MKLARSSVRVGLALALLAGAASGLGAFVGCGSDETESDADPSKDKDKDKGSIDGSSGDGDVPSQCAAPPPTRCLDGDAAACPCELTCIATECVPKAACNEALLSWNGPVSNTDGTCLRDLAGFSIYSVPDASGGPYPNVFDAGLPCVSVGTLPCDGDGGVAPDLRCSHRMANLSNGVWYFVVTAWTDAGVESPLSGEGAKVISCP